MKDASPTAKASYAIEVKQLTKSFGNNLALASIDLRIEHSQTLAIFGPNGAGKSTLIKVLASIMNPSSGEVLVNGLELKNNAELIRSMIGVVPHQSLLYSNLTAYENLEFYSRMYDVPHFKERILQVVAMVGMKPRLYDRVGTLSRGMQQRLSLARALLHKPTIMLLDEPETGLDQQAVSMLWRSLKEDEPERTVIFTSHGLERGLEVCDQVVILHKGRVVYQQSSQYLTLTSLRQAYQDNIGGGAG